MKVLWQLIVVVLFVTKLKESYGKSVSGDQSATIYRKLATRSLSGNKTAEETAESSPLVSDVNAMIQRRKRSSKSQLRRKRSIDQLQTIDRLIHAPHEKLQQAIRNLPGGALFAPFYHHHIYPTNHLINRFPSPRLRPVQNGLFFFNRKPYPRVTTKPCLRSPTEVRPVVVAKPATVGAVAPHSLYRTTTEQTSTSTTYALPVVVQPVAAATVLPAVAAKETTTENSPVPTISESKLGTYITAIPDVAVEETATGTDLPTITTEEKPITIAAIVPSVVVEETDTEKAVPITTTEKQPVPTTSVPSIVVQPAVMAAVVPSVILEETTSEQNAETITSGKTIAENAVGVAAVAPALLVKQSATPLLTDTQTTVLQSVTVAPVPPEEIVQETAEPIVPTQTVDVQPVASVAPSIIEQTATVDTSAIIQPSLPPSNAAILPSDLEETIKEHSVQTIPPLQPIVAQSVAAVAPAFDAKDAVTFATNPPLQQSALQPVAVAAIVPPSVAEEATEQVVPTAAPVQQSIVQPASGVVPAVVLKETTAAPVSPTIVASLTAPVASTTATFTSVHNLTQTINGQGHAFIIGGSSENGL